MTKNAAERLVEDTISDLKVKWFDLTQEAQIADDYGRHFDACQARELAERIKQLIAGWTASQDDS